MSFYGMYNSGVPTHQYYTLSLNNPPQSDATDQRPITYLETRNSPFLKDPQSYYASVVRFTCTTPQLPILVPSIKNEATGETHYSITMHHPFLNGGVAIRQNVMFKSVNPYTPKRPAVETPEYYYIYQPNEFIEMVNATLGSIWAQLIGSTAIQGDSPFIEWTNATDVGKLWVYQPFCQTPRLNATYPTSYPTGTSDSVTSATILADGRIMLTMASAAVASKYFRGDYITLSGFTPNANNTGAFPAQIFNVNGDKITVDKQGTGPITAFGNVLANTPIAIYMNASLYNLFSSFTAENQSSAIDPAPALGTHWKLIFQPTYTTATFPSNLSMPVYNTFPRSALNNYTYISQQYSTIPLWNPVSSFVFITSILPINPESISAPVEPGATLTSGGNNSAIGTVLTDFEIPLETGFETKPMITYAPTAEYRLVDMNGNSDLNSIQISIGWRNKIGVFQPLSIGQNGFAQIKILFRRKDFNGI